MVKHFATVLMISALVMLAACARGSSPSQRQGPTSSDGYVLHPDEAELLLGGNGQVTIIASPATGSPHFAMGTQQLLPGTSIPVHRHEHADEAFFVHSGTGVGIVGETRTDLREGDAVYVPRGVWHGFEADTDELGVVWFIAPPGLEEFFRETRVPPGTPLPSLTPEQMEQIGLRHGIRNKGR
jgi:quercetin dioxygenase-like cupin family protein